MTSLYAHSVFFQTYSTERKKLLRSFATRRVCKKTVFLGPTSVSNFLLSHAKILIGSSLRSDFFRLLGAYPGFSQDRVNFHQNPGRDTAGQADPTWPNRAGYSIPCAAMLGSGGGELGRGNSLVARERSVGSTRVTESSSAVWSVLFCVFPLSVSSLFLFPLFAVLLNCPYPDPPVSACFFTFSSAPQRGEGQLRGAFVASRIQNITVH